MITRAKAKEKGKNTAEKMTTTNADSERIFCPKFEIKGNIKFKNWIKFFERRCDEKNLEENDKLRVFPDFLGSEATAFFINNCMDIEKWDELKKIFMEHFSFEKKITFEQFIEMKLSSFTSLTEYFNTKTEAAQNLNLPREIVINSLNHGLPERHKNILASHQISDTYQWISIARIFIKEKTEIERPSMSRAAPLARQDRGGGVDPPFQHRPPYPERQRWRTPFNGQRSYHAPAYHERSQYRQPPARRQFRDEPFFQRQQNS